MNWQFLSNTEKLSLVVKLSQDRVALARESKSRRASTTRAAQEPKKMAFKSKELEELFYSMPKDVQKLMFGR